MSDETGPSWKCPHCGVVWVGQYSGQIGANYRLTYSPQAFDQKLGRLALLLIEQDAELERVRAQLAEARELLEELEFTGEDLEENQCQICRGGPTLDVLGHAPDCRLDAFLKGPHV